jgi:hypothetical protein
MTPMSSRPEPTTRRAAVVRRGQLLRAILAALLGLAAALLVACGTSTKGLIPAADSGPLQSDFETVQQAAENGDGSCTTTEAALAKTGEDFAALPSTVDAGLRNNLRQGISNLRARALEQCAQALTQTNTSTTTPKTTTTDTTTTSTTPPPTTTNTTTTETPPTTTTTPPTTPGPGGGTPAPGVGETPPGAGGGQGGGTGAGEGAQGNGAGGEAEAGKEVGK